MILGEPLVGAISRIPISAAAAWGLSGALDWREFEAQYAPFFSTPPV